MLRKLILGLLSLSLVLAVPQSFAASGKQDRAAQVSTPGPRKHLATIVFAGLAGAILGLSTLSFYGRPQDRLNNIAVGFAIGVISGTLYTTFKAATEPRDFYSSRNAQAESWAMNESLRRELSAPVPQTSFTFQF